MDSLDRMRLFARVVERASFTAAAIDLGLPRSTASEALKALERHVGARLLDRTTRHVATTSDGQAFYRRCIAILADIDEAENAFKDAQPRGVLRVDAHGLLTRTFLLPHLPQFLDRYPLLEVHLGQGDRLVDLIREGVDCVIRAGEPADSGLILHRLGSIEEITVASPAYLARHGTPERPDALEGHRMIGFASSKTGDVLPLEFLVGGVARHIALPSRVTVNESDTMADLARLGLGLVQAPRYRFTDDLAQGRLIEVLPENRPSRTLLSALYPQNRQMAPRLRVFLDWAATLFRAAL